MSTYSPQLPGYGMMVGLARRATLRRLGALTGESLSARGGLLENISAKTWIFFRQEYLERRLSLWGKLRKIKTQKNVLCWTRNITTTYLPTPPGCLFVFAWLTALLQDPPTIPSLGSFPKMFWGTRPSFHLHRVSPGSHAYSLVPSIVPLS